MIRTRSRQGYQVVATILIGGILATLLLFLILKATNTFTILFYFLMLSVFLITSLKPLYGLYVVVGFITLLGGKGALFVGNFWIQVSELATIIVAIAWLLNLFITNRDKPSFNGLLKYYAIFILACVPSILKGSESGSSAAYVLFDISLYLRYILIGIIAYNIIGSRDELTKVLRLFIFFGTIVSLFALYVYYLKPSSNLLLPESTFGGYGRVASTFGNPNSFAGFLEVLLPINFALLFYIKRKRTKYLLIISSILGLWALVLTYSRGGFVAILVSLIIILVISPAKAAYKMVSISMLTILLLAAISSSSLSRQRSIFSSQTFVEETVEGGRVMQYYSYYDDFIGSPIIGIGWGFHQVGYSFYPQVSGRVDVSGLNSFFLDLLVKGGFLSFVGFMILFFAILKRLTKAMKKRKEDIEFFLILGIIAGISGFIFHQLFDNLIKWPMGGMVFWFLVGIGIVALKTTYKTDHD